MIINDLDGYYIVFDTKNRNMELDTLTTCGNPRFSTLWFLNDKLVANLRFSKGLHSKQKEDWVVTWRTDDILKVCISSKKKTE